jgi:hypothetical protein
MAEWGQIIQFRPRSAEPCRSESIIACLTALLERAQAGEVLGIALAVVLPDGNVGSQFDTGEHANRADLAWGIAILQQRLLEESDG